MVWEVDVVSWLVFGLFVVGVFVVLNFVVFGMVGLLLCWLVMYEFVVLCVVCWVV